jgi:hypothetical protein
MTRSVHSPYARVYDSTNQHWSRNPVENQMFLQAQEAYANDRLHGYGYIFLNDIYDMLGFPRTAAGQLVGWFQEEGSNSVHFDVEEVSADKFMLQFNPDGVMYDKLPTV